MQSTAFAPGHITGFFSPFLDKQSYERSGSTGAGINLDIGATSTVQIDTSSEQKIQINGKTDEYDVTRKAIHHLIDQTPVYINIKTTFDLPISQGFGMSAAGALSTTLAISHLLKIPIENALRSTHYAEVEMTTGLGDALASFFGGIEIRRKPGLPPYGFLEHINDKRELVLCILGKGLETRSILNQPSCITHLQTLGQKCLQGLIHKPTLENFMRLSQEFTIHSKLADAQILDALYACSPHGIASMTMLGSSIFAIGDTPLLKNTLSEYGQVLVCEIDTDGARIVR